MYKTILWMFFVISMNFSSYQIKSIFGVTTLCFTNSTILGTLVWFLRKFSSWRGGSSSSVDLGFSLNCFCLFI